ncbi:hypothetical protein MYU51_006633 [Penicillium brevicompactum]|uniref:uncharacterized protein n=1 Tax=Penicillium brevicompactum TaxID=5074 RepID=UPI002540FCCE|nr:uncharacterized protein N7506_012249 [Penicillium brevicompactum]KAJ5319545.1 hypothetical protein N7506_012249 [Penicillium brevicompactum]
MSSQQPAENSAPKTQRYCLTANIEGLRTERVITLENAADLKLWKSLISFRLQSLDCQDLIRGDLARPKPEDKGYADWGYCSIVIGNWICNQVSTSVKRRLENRGVGEGKGMFADDLMDKIEKIVLGDSSAQSILERLIPFWGIDYEECDSVEEFIREVYNEMQAFHDLKAPLPWIIALAKVLDPLEDDLPSVALIRDELKEIPADELTREKFLILSERLKIEAEMKGI